MDSFITKGVWIIKFSESNGSTSPRLLPSEANSSALAKSSASFLSSAGRALKTAGSNPVGCSSLAFSARNASSRNCRAKSAKVFCLSAGRPAAISMICFLRSRFPLTRKAPQSLNHLTASCSKNTLGLERRRDLKSRPNSGASCKIIPWASSKSAAPDFPASINFRRSVLFTTVR